MKRTLIILFGLALLYVVGCSDDFVEVEPDGFNDTDFFNNQEEYESDGGTRYIRDKRSGNWIHEAFMMEQQQQLNQRQQAPHPAKRARMASKWGESRAERELQNLRGEGVSGPSLKFVWLTNPHNSIPGC